MSTDHFVDVNKMVDIGSGSQREIDDILITAAQSKIEVNERKYPVEKAKGSAEKYTVYV